MTILDKIKRRIYLKKVISNIGTIKENDEYIMCCAKQSVIDKKMKNGIYDLNCNGKDIKFLNDKKNHIGFSKPVYYTFEGIHFEGEVYLTSTSVEVRFLNCTFNNGIHINGANKVEFVNNKYNCWKNKSCGKAFLTGNARIIEFNNNNFVNLYKLGENNFGINLEAEDFYIEDSNIVADTFCQINIKAQKISLWRSSINAPKIYLDSEMLVLDRSLLTAEKEIKLSVKNKTCVEDINLNNVKSPYIVYNGTELTESDKIKESKKAILNQLYSIYREIVNRNGFISITEEDSVYKMEIKDYITLNDYTDKMKIIDTFGLYDKICNCVLWNNRKQKVNKGIYYVLEDNDRLYNILVDYDYLTIDERIKIDDIIEEKVIRFNKNKEELHYSSLKHDKNGSTFYTKYYNTRGFNFGKLSFPQFEAYQEINAIILNLMGCEKISNIFNTDTINPDILNEINKTLKKEIN